MNVRTSTNWECVRVSEWGARYTHFLSGWANKSPNFLRAIKLLFPKLRRSRNSGSEYWCCLLVVSLEL